MTLVPKSLTWRVIGLSTVWAAVTLIAIATVISTVYRQASSRNFDRVLDAHLFNLIGAVGADGEGRLSGAPEFGDIRYSEPGSGWYWSVERPDDPEARPLRSASMTSDIAVPQVAEVPFDQAFRREYVAKAPGGQEVRVVESEFLVGEQNIIARFRLMGNETEFRADIAAFDRALWTYLGLFGLGMIAINALAILLGLRPLDRVRKALASVREGTADRLEGAFPREIEPLANEMNALIENNRRIVERSRTQVGNLAHSLKTPLAVLLNEGEAIGGSKGDLIVRQAESMRGQVDHYLQRARIAAQRDSIVYRADLKPVLERMVRVMGKLAPGKTFFLDLAEPAPVFAGEREDIEEILGNLLENAAKWARSRIEVSLRSEGSDKLCLEIADDGPGIPPAKAQEALLRGKRLDETVPGTGLGLSIVAELISEYGGNLRLGSSALGGLLVSVLLPAAR